MLDENLDEWKRKVQSLEAYKERLVHQSTKEIDSLHLEVNDLKRTVSDKDDEIEDQICKGVELAWKNYLRGTYNQKLRGAKGKICAAE